jgi:hypothetical protein
MEVPPTTVRLQNSFKESMAVALLVKNWRKVTSDIAGSMAYLPGIIFETPEDFYSLPFYIPGKKFIL